MRHICRLENDLEEKNYDFKNATDFWLYSAKTNYNFEFKLLIMNNIRIFSNIGNMFFSNFYP